MTPSAPLKTQGPVAERALLFEFDRRPYGLRLGSVAGLGEAGEIRSVAGAPSSVLGLSDWRGRLLTVVDLAALLDELSREINKLERLCLAPLDTMI